MRKVILGLSTSIHGYIARLNGAVDFLFMPKDYSMAPFFATIDTALMGGRLWMRRKARLSADRWQHTCFRVRARLETATE